MAESGKEGHCVTAVGYMGVLGWLIRDLCLILDVVLFILKWIVAGPN